MLLLTIVSLESGCKKNGCYNPESGLNRIYDIPKGVVDFYFNDAFEIKLVQDSSEQIIITADQNNIDKINFNHVSNKLIVENSGICDMIRGKKNIPSLEIHASEVDTLKFTEYCSVVSEDTLFYKYLYLYFSGEIGNCDIYVDNRNFVLSAGVKIGNFDVQGNTIWSQLSSEGASVVNTNKLKSMKSVVSSFSNRELSLNAQETVTINIYSSGDVVLCGAPDSIKVARLGSGGVIMDVNDCDKR